MMALAALLPAATVYGAAADAGNVTVEVVGKSAVSMEMAKEDALRQAVEMGGGKHVWSNTSVVDFKLMRDTIVTRAVGYVRTYDILKEWTESGVYAMKIRAEIGVSKLKDDWGAIQLLIQRKGRPNLLILVTEEGKGVKLGGNTAEYKLRELIGERGFDIIDDEMLKNVTERDAVRAARAGDEKKALAMALQLHAGYVVLGKVSARALPAEKLYNIKATPVIADLDVKVVATDNARQLASKSASATVRSENAVTAARKAITQAAASAEPAIVQRILSEWSRDLDGGTKIDLIGTRIPTDVLNPAIDALRKVEGISMVRVVDHNEDMTTLAVVGRLEPKDVGEALERASGAKLSVTGYSTGRVTFGTRKASAESDPQTKPAPTTPAGETK